MIFNSPTYKAQHAGWLLACDAPKNIAKGENLYASLDDRGRRIADEYRDKCLKIYADARVARGAG